MNEYINNTYWIAVAHLPKWTIERTNRFIIQIIHECKMSWVDFFALDKNGWQELFAFTDKELADLTYAKTDMPRLAFIAEQLQNEGFQIIPINAPDYPAVLKENLKIKSSPPVLYIKGKKALLQENSVAIVGSRKAGTKALDFTDQIARKCVAEHKVVVSGFAKGVDQQALDSALSAKGKSIIVLPQGILTFSTGFKKYYGPIVEGDVLVLSTFFPKAGWDVGLAMARNAYIYGLAKEIFVAESDTKGGTWEGVMDGLKRNRIIFVRYPEPNEKNANLKLIESGAKPVGMSGEIVTQHGKPSYGQLISEELTMVNEEPMEYKPVTANKEKVILNLLEEGTFTAKEIMIQLKLDWSAQKLTGFLKKNPDVRSIPGKPLRFTTHKTKSLTLF